MKLRLAYFGTPEFAGDLLEKIIANDNLKVDVSFVVTQPDQPIGRKKIITPSQVKQVASKHGIRIFESLEIPSELLQKIDFALIYYYGKIIPAHFLALPHLGFWNIHFSRLPQYRGATPATFSLIMSDPQTAISLVQTDKKLDYGPLISQDIVDIDPTETRLQLEQKLHNKLPNILEREIKTIDTISKRLKKQDHSKATYTLIPTRDHGFLPISTLNKAMNNEPLTTDEIPPLIKAYFDKNKMDLGSSLDLVNSGKIIFDYYRGLHTWPGIWSLLQKRRMKIIDAPLTDNCFKINTIQFEGETPKKFNGL